MRKSWGSGLPTERAAAPVAASTAATTEPVAGPRAVGHREGRVAARAPHLGPAQHGLHRAAQLGEVEALVAADHDDLGAIGQVGVVEDPQAGVGHVAVHGLRADHERRRVPGLGQHVLQRAARGDDLLARGLEAEAPQLAHEVVLAVARVVGHEGQPATRPRAAALTASTAPGGGLVAHPDAAVEVQQEQCRRARGQARRARECAHYPRRRATDPPRPMRRPARARRLRRRRRRPARRPRRRPTPPAPASRARRSRPPSPRARST